MKPHAVETRQIIPLRPARAKLEPVEYNGLTLKSESFTAIVRELPILFKMHHEELAVDPQRAPLDPDWDKYFDAERAGQLHILTVRDARALVGYVFDVVGSHPHKRSTLWCHVDMFWLHPGYRSGFLGLKLLKLNEKFMRLFGVKKIVISEKCHFKNDMGKQVNVLFKRLGYAPEDMLYGKWIGD